MTSLRLFLVTVAVLAVLPLSSALAAPVNDSRLSPTTINTNGQIVSSSTTGATVDNHDHEAPGTGTHSVWYSWTAPQNGMVTITNASSAFNPVVAVYTDGNNCCPFREDHDSGAGDDAVVSFYVLAGRHYEILVDGEDPAQFGQFTLTVAFDSTPPSPFNDDFSSADNLGTGTYASRSAVNGLFATDETFEPSHRGVQTSHSLWYKWTPAATGGTRVLTSCKYGPSDFYGTGDPIVAVYTGASLGGLSQVFYTDTEWVNDCTRDFVQFTAIAGVTYRIAIDAGAGQIGESGPLTVSQDTSVPTVSFDNVTTYGANQAVKFTPSESAKAQCRLDGGAIVACGMNEHKLVNAAAGNHKLEVRPTDYHGNVGQWATKSFTVSTTPPQTQILGGPAAVSNKSDSAFTFSSSKPGSKFECRYPTKAWFDCGNTGSYVYKWYYAKLDQVTFEVRAIDALGNVDPTPSAFAWTHDFKAPKLTFPYQSPTAQAGKPLTFSWSTDEDAKLECSVDGSAYAACTSPFTLPISSAVGNRTLKVRATDKAGNSTESQRTGYQSSLPKTGTTPTTTTSSTTVRPTTTTTGQTGSTFVPRSFVSLRLGVRSITKAKLLRSGLRFTGACRPSCRMTVRLVAGRTILSTVTTRGSATLKLGKAARKALAKVKKGTMLRITATAPGSTQTQRLRLA